MPDLLIKDMPSQLNLTQSKQYTNLINTLGTHNSPILELIIVYFPNNSPVLTLYSPPGSPYPLVDFRENRL